MADMGMAGNDYEEEYLWGATFTSANKEFTWSPEESEKDGATEEEDKDDPSVKPGHRLLLKTAVLMPEAKKDDVCILQVESEGYNKTKVITPIVAMRGGADHQLYVDVLVPHKATFKLIQGEGPIHLVGSHCVNFFGYRLVINSVLTLHSLYHHLFSIAGTLAETTLMMKATTPWTRRLRSRCPGPRRRSCRGRKTAPARPATTRPR